MTVAERVAAINFKFETNLLTPAILLMEYRRSKIALKKLITMKQDPERRQ